MVNETQVSVMYSLKKKQILGPNPHHSFQSANYKLHVFGCVQNVVGQGIEGTGMLQSALISMKVYYQIASSKLSDSWLLCLFFSCGCLHKTHNTQFPRLVDASRFLKPDSLSHD